MAQSILTLLVAACGAIVALAATSELKTETIKTGDCSRVAKNGDNLVMHYEGKLDDGSEFDSSFKRDVPFKFQLGQGMVIKGWDKGLDGMCKGEVRNLIIPSHMGYGDAGYPPVIPKKATLHFKVELLGWDEDERDL